MHNYLQGNYPDCSFFLTAAIFLIALPFAESGISIYFGRLIGHTGKWGFSGIVWAFYAYLLFLLLVILYDVIEGKLVKKIQQQNNVIYNQHSITSVILSLILISSITIILPLYTILLDIGNETINYFGHLAGFTLGLVISSMAALICETQRTTSRIGLIFILAFFLVFSSIFWYFM